MLTLSWPFINMCNVYIYILYNVPVLGCMLPGLLSYKTILNPFNKQFMSVYDILNKQN